MQRKQARTGEEREESDGENVSDDDSDDEKDDDIPYNPKNLPLGWDGKVSYGNPLVLAAWCIVIACWHLSTNLTRS